MAKKTNRTSYLISRKKHNRIMAKVAEDYRLGLIDTLIRFKRNAERPIKAEGEVAERETQVFVSGLVYAVDGMIGLLKDPEHAELETEY